MSKADKLHDRLIALAEQMLKFWKKYRPLDDRTIKQLEAILKENKES